MSIFLFRGNVYDMDPIFNGLMRLKPNENAILTLGFPDRHPGKASVILLKEVPTISSTRYVATSQLLINSTDYRQGSHNNYELYLPFDLVPRIETPDRYTPLWSVIGFNEFLSHGSFKKERLSRDWEGRNGDFGETESFKISPTNAYAPSSLTGGPSERHSRLVNGETSPAMLKLN